jgi:hypothetical protein
VMPGSFADASEFESVMYIRSRRDDVKYYLHSRARVLADDSAGVAAFRPMSCGLPSRGPSAVPREPVPPERVFVSFLACR